MNYNFLKNIAKLPKWFGERPGKRAGDPETPEGEEDAKVGAEEEEIEEEEVEEKHVS
jgi:troponin T